MMTLGQRITALRNYKRLTQEQVAEALGVKRARYNAWEHGISNPDHLMLVSIARFHGVTVDFLLGHPHPEGTTLLTEDMYADGYTDESFFEDLEKELERNYKNKTTEGNEKSVLTPSWASKKDTRDFKKMLEEDAPVMFDGVPLDDEDKEKIMRVMEAIFWDAKKKNKRKATDE